MLLREKDKQMLLQIFRRVDMPFEVWAYGSRVNGGAHEGSDLDLVIRGASLARIPSDTFVTLCENIRDSNIPILVELRDWAMLPESFHANIGQRYEVLFDNQSAPAYGH
jgi:predicted nucleotidyltransferase